VKFSYIRKISKMRNKNGAKISLLRIENGGCDKKTGF